MGDEDLLDGDKLIAIDLKVNEYVKILDKSTGDIRVVGGPGQVMLGPHEKCLDDGKKKSVEVDAEHAVLVRDKGSVQVRLVTENQLFVPGPHESIEEIRELIKLADHEAIIVKDQQGLFKYYYGSDKKRAPDQPRSFFLPPYAEIVQLCWGRGRRREKRDLFISRFDTRAQYIRLSSIVERRTMWSWFSKALSFGKSLISHAWFRPPATPPVTFVTTPA